MIRRPPRSTLFPYTNALPILKYFNLYPGRFPLVHVKDLKKIPPISTGGAQNFGDTVDLTEVGSGIIDWKDRKSTRLNSSHQIISYAVFCLKKKKKKISDIRIT